MKWASYLVTAFWAQFNMTFLAPPRNFSAVAALAPRLTGVTELTASELFVTLDCEVRGAGVDCCDI